MKKPLFIILTTIFLYHSGKSQYWQQQVDYVIDVQLNDKNHTLTGFEKLTYTNNSPDTLHFIWFHLWPNAYKNDQTAFSNQLLQNGDTKFYFSSKEERGYINRLDFKVNGTSAKTEDHPQHIDIIKLVLPGPLLPSQKITISTPFHVQLPLNFSRGGHVGQSYQITQWYPKPAVYDVKGWHEMPYLDKGEFYSEFGSFDVRITVPSNYVVAATGDLQNEDEKKWLLHKSIESEAGTQKSPAKSVKPANKQSAAKSPQKKPANGIKAKTPTANQKTETGYAAKTLQYIQKDVHDFAWFADKNFIVNHDTCKLSSGKIIEVYSFYTPAQKRIWKNSVQLAKDALRFYSKEIGEYPYNTLSAVQGPISFAGGMEYPTITVISPLSYEKDLDITLAHEIGHNWFYGILASNERKYPWMDEGFNHFYESKYNQQKYGKTAQWEDIALQTIVKQKKDQPITSTSEELSDANYGLIAYEKTSRWLQVLEERLGAESFRKLMQEYYNRWQFKHPQPEDFQKIFYPALGNDGEKYFSLLNEKGLLPNQQTKGWKIVTPFNPKTFKSFAQAPSKNALLISPAIGINSYDGLMVGGIISNYKLPPTNFQFIAVPLYGTRSKELNGIGRLSYSIYSAGKIRRTEFFVNGSTFSMDEYKDSSDRQHLTRFQKLVPGLRLTLRENDPHSRIRRFVQWKTFLIREGSFRFGTDTLINGNDTTYKEAISVHKNSRWLNQLQFVYENNRALYPFDVRLNIEQTEDLLRPTLTANYFFNYAKGGGLDVRLFAGKIFYFSERTLVKSFRNYRYHLNMTGPDGYEDYTYGNYFIGRNKFEGLPSQQMMMRDGGFKFRTDLLGNEIGKTDRWLAAVNFSSTIPKKINPLSVLPFTIPLRVFADIGTYAEAWDRNSEEDRFLFDAGLQLPLFNEAINVYFPIFYSKVYSDYYKSYLTGKRFLKSVSFTIHLNTRTIKEVNRQIEL